MTRNSIALGLILALLIIIIGPFIYLAGLVFNLTPAELMLILTTILIAYLVWRND
jgi:flagellar motor component MotA